MATLIRLVGDFDLAEDALQEAFAAAVAQWPSSERPFNPGAWIVNVGRHKAIDRLRRQAFFPAKCRDLTAEAEIASETTFDADTEAIADDMLRLVFTCCHPALNMESRVALTLHAVCGRRWCVGGRLFGLYRRLCRHFGG